MTKDGKASTTCVPEDVALSLMKDLGTSRVPKLAGLRGSDARADVRLFVGNWSTTMYHYDGTNDALIVQVNGAKLVVAAPPSATAAIGVDPDDGACRFGTGTEIGRGSAWSPEFAMAAPGARLYELRPGDALFMPRFWWHAVYGEPVPAGGAPSLTVSYFYAPPGAPTLKDEGVVQRIAAALEHDGVETASEVLNPGADKLQIDCQLKLQGVLRHVREPLGRDAPRRRMAPRRQMDYRFRRGRDALPQAT